MPSVGYGISGLTLLLRCFIMRHPTAECSGKCEVITALNIFIMFTRIVMPFGLESSNQNGCIDEEIKSRPVRGMLNTAHFGIFCLSSYQKA